MLPGTLPRSAFGSNGVVIGALAGLVEGVLLGPRTSPPGLPYWPFSPQPAKIDVEKAELIKAAAAMVKRRFMVRDPSIGSGKAFGRGKVGGCERP